jgi:surfeit locus 1 family protein
VKGIPDRRSRLWPAVAAVIGIAITASLGNWQLNRAAEKRELKARADAYAAQPPIHVSAAEIPVADIAQRRVEARGMFDPRYAVYIDNRLYRGMPGYHVIMPLELAGGARYVLVNRGWIARPLDRRDPPRVSTPQGEVTVEGTASLPSARVLELSEHVTEGRIWQNLTLERYREVMPIAIQPFVVLQDRAPEDGLVREWAPADFGIDKHYGYAFQWFGLAATIAIFYAVTQFRRSRAQTP